MHGKGKYSLPSGDYYLGEFEDNQFNGTGTFVFANGDRYVGTFLRGKFCGRGRFEYAGGGYYDGEYLAMKKGAMAGVKKFLAADGKREGRGVRVWVSGNRYEGEWKQDKMHGFGVFDGTIGGITQRYEGVFERGHRSGRGVCHYGNTDGQPFICPFGHRHVRQSLHSTWNHACLSHVVGWCDCSRTAEPHATTTVIGILTASTARAALCVLMAVCTLDRCVVLCWYWRSGTAGGDAICGHGCSSGVASGMARACKSSCRTCTEAPPHECTWTEWMRCIELNGKEGTTRWAPLLPPGDASHVCGMCAWRCDVRSYDGEWDNGVRHGDGSLVFENGDRIDGFFRSGNLHGPATITWKKGQRQRRALFEFGMRKRWISSREIAADCKMAELLRDMPSPGSSLEDDGSHDGSVSSAPGSVRRSGL